MRAELANFETERNALLDQLKDFAVSVRSHAHCGKWIEQQPIDAVTAYVYRQDI